MILENSGIITDDNYYQDREYITASMVKAAVDGSKKKYDYIMKQTEPTESMLAGSAFHSMMLEPDKFKSTYAFEPNMDKRTKAGKEYIAQWKKDNEHIPHHLPGKYEEMLINMHESLSKSDAYNYLVKPDGEFEQIKLFELEGVKCKSKIDYYNPADNYVVDIKTCQKLDIDAILDAIKQYKYGIQAAFYLDGLKAHKFYFVFIEKKAPYDNVCVEYNTGIDGGRKAYKAGIKNIQTFNSLGKDNHLSYAFGKIIQI